MRWRLFAPLLVLALGIPIAMPWVLRHAKAARIERSRVFPTSENAGLFERRLLGLGCTSVVLIPLKESLARPMNERHVPQWWVHCPGPANEYEVAAQGKSLIGGALIQTDGLFVQLDASGDVVDRVPIVRPNSAHDHRTGTRRVLGFLQAWFDW